MTAAPSTIATIATARNIDPRLLTATDLTSGEKRRVTRLCRSIADLALCLHEDEVPDLCALARVADAVSDYPIMQRTLLLWEAMPAKERARIERRAVRARERARANYRREQAAKPPYLGKQPAHSARPEYRHLRRFDALHIAVRYGTPLLHPLRTTIHDAILDGERAAYEAAVAVWGTWPAGQREEIVRRAHRLLVTGGVASDWWIHELIALPVAADPEGEAGVLTELETRRLAKRFAHLSREEHAAD